MAAVKIERRIYVVSPHQLFGICLTALGQLRAAIERHDVEQGTIIAAFGAGALAPASELSLVLRSLGEGQTELLVTWRARKRGGDRHLLNVFLDSIDSLTRLA